MGHPLDTVDRRDRLYPGGAKKPTKQLRGFILDPGWGLGHPLDTADRRDRLNPRGA